MIMKILNKLAFAWFCVGLIGACSQNSTNSDDYIGSNLAEPLGQFVEAKVVDSSQTPLHEDCSSSGGVIDARLKTGMSFEILYKAMNGFKVNKQLSYRARITAVDTAHLQEQVMPLYASGLTASVGQEEPLTCAYDNQGKGSCTPPSFVSAANVTTNGDYAQCQITGEGSGNKNERASVGKFNMGGGKSVDAYLITRSSKGNLNCNGRSISGGDHLETIIITDSVPAEGKSSACGGTQLFHFESYRNNNRRVMLGYSYERTTIP